MISGMYLGDIVRRVILRMSYETDIFGSASSKLTVPFVLRSVSSLSRGFIIITTFFFSIFFELSWNRQNSIIGHKSPLQEKSLDSDIVNFMFSII